ncbi:hypothetical protein Lcho_2242 [Leptothrix cholodnii SP-6]|uniref:Mu-like prophage FluMu N-terminal domain-containing protein n=1 Tax=Leptothrix cholodnii (strain ATCC 51168 / LMG 8142 / SP-6) TaxID=395495 RepID=B1Y3I0_LEPCP|nr:hypothetical protein [Leptothrix cholodnii]ACB34508.1 hypothetical protein Lcho_2242 [Leptothrix cholodnii SP-6]
MATKPKTLPAITVTSRSPRGNLWRAGRDWSAQPTTVAISELSDAQIAALKAEPLLLVQNAEITPDGEVGQVE